MLSKKASVFVSLINYHQQQLYYLAIWLFSLFFLCKFQIYFKQTIKRP